MTHLLLNEKPMMVLPSLAKAYGNANKAIAVQHVHWVVTIKEEYEDDRTFYDGHLWCKLSLKQWQQKLCWMSMSGIRKMLTQLEETETVISCKPFSATGDHTKWYRIDHEKLSIFACPKVTNPELSKSDTPACPKVTNLDVPKSDKSSIDKKISKDPFKESEGKTDLPTENTQTILAGQTNQQSAAPKSKPSVKENNSAAACNTNVVRRDAFAESMQARLLVTGFEKVKELVEEFCPWEKFFQARKNQLATTSYYEGRNIVEGTVAKKYQKLLDEKDPNRWNNSMQDWEWAITKVKELIKTDVEELGLNSISAANQGREQRRKAFFESIHQQYKKNPAKAREMAGDAWNEFVNQYWDELCRA